MKYKILIILIGFVQLIFSQNGNANLSETLNSISKSNANNFGAFMSFSNSRGEIEGSVHLFKNWANNAVIHTQDNKKFRINNINLNLQRNTFESKIAEDSLFTFNFSGIKKFVINNKTFKNYYYNDDNRVYEIIYEDDKLSILKGFNIQVLAGSPNPMLNRVRDKYIQKYTYLLRKDNEIKPFKLNKNGLMRLFNDDDSKVFRVENYVKTAGLASDSENIDLGSALNKNISQDDNNSSVAVSSGLSNINTHGTSFYFTNPKRQVDGTYYLFEDWKNNAEIFISGSSSFVLKNINLNLKRNTFETRVTLDSLFTFNFNNIDRFVVNDKVYKNFYYDDDNRVYEIIYESEEFSLLKGFKVVMVEGSANPMLNRTRDKYIRKHYYFVKQGETINRFKLKKSKILKLFDDTEKAMEIEAYAKANKLSFKKENDIRKILEN